MSYAETNNDRIVESTVNSISNGKNAIHNTILVDLRSDTFTRPTATMREAMSNAEVGDDVFEEDPTVQKLEAKAAALLGKEAALFVPSGTMANLIAILNHCDVRGSEAYCGEDAHIVCHEQGGAAQIGGVTLCTLPNKSDGTFDLKNLEYRIGRNSIHEPIAKLIHIENPINGKVLPQAWIEELATIAIKHNLKIHMDGARLWNASIASGVPAKHIVSKVDSVGFCLSKGLGAPVGSLLCGTKSFIVKARRLRKVLGGAMRQIGVLAAAGLVALEEILPKLKDDHRRANLISEAICNLKSKVFTVDFKTVQTNMIFVNVNSETLNAADFVHRLQEVRTERKEDAVIVKALAQRNVIRFVLYHQITDEMIEAAICKITYVIKELDPTVS